MENILSVPSGLLSEVTTALFNCKGQFISCSFVSQVEPKAAFKGTKLSKSTQGTFRAGIDYANLKPILEGIAEGTRGSVGSLPWGRWEHFPYTILHTPKGETEEKRYIRLYPTENCHLKVQYFVDNVAVTKEVFKTYLRQSDIDRMESGERPLVICPKEENLTKVGK
jgi:hypothetical protein